MQTTPSEVKKMDVSLHQRHSLTLGSLAQCQNFPPLPDFWRDINTPSTCAKMALPTKKEFLATLEPVEHSDCSICKTPMTSPVRLPCQGAHEFCKACITEWFNQSNSNECPMCRQPLFSKDVADIADITFPVRASPETHRTSRQCFQI